MEKIEKYEINVSDWITFLSSEKFGFISTILGLGSIIIAVLLVGLAPGWYRLSGIFFVYLYIWYAYSGKKIEERGKLAESILDAIMKEQIAKDEIQRRWSNGIEKIKIRKRYFWKAW